MNSNLVLYSFVEAYKKNNDIKGLFAMILLYFSKDEGENKLQLVLDKISDELSVNIPYEIGRNLVKKLKKDSYLEDMKTLDSYLLSDRGKNKREEMLKNRMLGSNDNVIKDIERDLNKIGINSSLKELFNNISESNVMQVDFFIGDNHRIPQNISKDITIFGEYFNKLDRNSEKYKVISSVLLCFILSHYLGREEIQRNISLSGLDVYLDSNILVSLFGLHSEELNKSISDLIYILAQNGCNLKVFDFTLTEFVNVLSAYNPSKYTTEYPVNSMYYFMKIKGITKEKVELMVGNIEEQLKNLRIGIDYDYNVAWENKNIETIQGYESDLRDCVIDAHLNREQKKDRAIRHDIAAYLAIKDIRRKKRSLYKNLLEESGAIFLTSDIGLCKFVTQKIKDSRRGIYIPEVIHNFNLLSYVWFKNPVSNKNLLFQDFIISSHQQKFISENLWNSFVYELRKTIDDKKYTEEECEQLIAVEETKEQLLNLEKNVVNDNYGYDFSNIINDENIAKVKNEKIQKDKQIDDFFRTNKILEEEKNVANTQLANIEETIKNRARNKAEKLRIILIIMLGFLLLIMLVIIWYKINWLFCLLAGGVIGIFYLCFHLITHKSFLNYLLEKTEDFKNRKIQDFIIKEKKRVGFNNNK